MTYEEISAGQGQKHTWSWVLVSSHRWMLLDCIYGGYIVVIDSTRYQIENGGSNGWSELESCCLCRGRLRNPSSLHHVTRLLGGPMGHMKSPDRSSKMPVYLWPRLTADRKVVRTKCVEEHQQLTASAKAPSDIPLLPSSTDSPHSISD